MGTIVLYMSEFTPVDWMSDAACSDKSPDMFFPVGKTANARSTEAQAKKVCSTCIVKVDCLEYALYHSIDHGIWGGVNEDDRRFMRRERRRERLSQPYPKAQ
jgi:WhiB family transcriptional regulator, redox-sensing transcriptional regulator